MRGSPAQEGEAPLCLTLYTVNPQKFSFGLDLCQWFIGVTSRARVLRKAPAQAELRPTCAGPPPGYAGVQNLHLVFYSPASRRVAANQFCPISISPSVTSVASVRCFPRDVCYSPASRRVAANQFRPIPISPLCDLRGLCAMLSPRRVLLAHRAVERSTLTAIS
jgi:hypothetical protein